MGTEIIIQLYIVHNIIQLIFVLGDVTVKLMLEVPVQWALMTLGQQLQTLMHPVQKPLPQQHVRQLTEGQQYHYKTTSGIYS